MASLGTTRVAGLTNLPSLNIKTGNSSLDWRDYVSRQPTGPMDANGSTITSAPSNYDNGFDITPVNTGGTKPAWSMDGAMDGLAGLFGTDAKTLKSAGDMFGKAAPIIFGTYDMYVKDKAMKAAEEEAAYQRSVSQEKLALARQDRAEFRGYRTTNTNKFNSVPAMDRTI